MPLSEKFSMAPLSRGCHPIQYKVPGDFDWGSGMVKRLQEDLVSQYETLHCNTNRFLEAEGCTTHYGDYSVRMTIAQCEDSLRTARNDVLKLMAHIYHLGHKPLSPLEEVDSDVSRILHEPRLTPAARALAGLSPQETASNYAKAVSTKAVAGKPRFMSAARARAEEAWEAQARSEANERASDMDKANLKARLEAVRRSTAVARTPPSTKGAALPRARSGSGGASMADAMSSSTKDVDGKPRFMSRGAAARARAEAAWEAQARSEANERASDWDKANLKARLEAVRRSPAVARTPPSKGVAVPRTRCGSDGASMADAMSRAEAAVNAVVTPSPRDEGAVMRWSEASIRTGKVITYLYRGFAPADDASKADAMSRSEGRPWCSGSVLPSVTGRSRVQAPASAHYVRVWLGAEIPSPDPAQRGSLRHWVRPFYAARSDTNHMDEVALSSRAEDLPPSTDTMDSVVFKTGSEGNQWWKF